MFRRFGHTVDCSTRCVVDPSKNSNNTIFEGIVKNWLTCQQSPLVKKRRNKTKLLWLIKDISAQYSDVLNKSTRRYAIKYCY